MTDIEQVKREFPDFDVATLPMIPKGFECTAWHNDTCPTWQEGENVGVPKAGDLLFAVDYLDPAMREMPEFPRFSLLMYDAGGLSHELMSGEDWSQIEATVAYARYVRLLGLGFHVNTRGKDYVMWADGARVFKGDEAAEYDRVVDEVHGFADPYELAFKVWKILGLTN